MDGHTMNRYFIEISFKGTAFHGWQIQPHAVTIQEIVNNACTTVLKEPISVIGAGRTDAGVHARKFTAHFDSQHYDQAGKTRFLYSINSVLPEDIAVLDIYPVIPGAHARYSALSRVYEFRIRQSKNPFEKEFSFFYPHKIDIGKMNDAAAILPEYHDFSSFSKCHTQVKTKVCKIKHAEWTNRQGLLVFTIEADRFLRNMVRAIVGTLLEVGRGKLTLEEFRQIILKSDRKAAGSSVPAKGLFFLDAIYPDEIRLDLQAIQGHE